MTEFTEYVIIDDANLLEIAMITLRRRSAWRWRWL